MPSSPAAASPRAHQDQPDLRGHEGDRAHRDRRDRCPGVTRPWPADDGQLVRVRLVGGRTTVGALRALGDIATTWGDGRVRLTGRANLQLRALPTEVPVAAFEAAGVLPSRSHELVRNVMVSPQSGLAGGRCDLRPVADELDRLLLADPATASLPGRFLFVLDDGRGDLAGRTLDLGLVALDAGTVQLRVGSDGWGPVVALGQAARSLAALATTFLARRGHGPGAAWHVDELGEPLAPAVPREDRTRVATGPLPYGDVPGGTHVAAPDDGLGPSDIAAIAGLAGPPGPPGDDAVVVVTPWRGVLVPS